MILSTRGWQQAELDMTLSTKGWQTAFQDGHQLMDIVYKWSYKAMSTTERYKTNMAWKFTWRFSTKFVLLKLVWNTGTSELYMLRLTVFTLSINILYYIYLDSIKSFRSIWAVDNLWIYCKYRHISNHVKNCTFCQDIENNEPWYLGVNCMFCNKYVIVFYRSAVLHEQRWYLRVLLHYLAFWFWLHWFWQSNRQIKLKFTITANWTITPSWQHNFYSGQ